MYDYYIYIYIYICYIYVNYTNSGLQTTIPKDHANGFVRRPRFFSTPCERPLPLHLKVLLLGHPTIWAHQSIPWQWLPASLPHPEASAWCGSTGYRDQDGINTNEDAHIGKPSRMSFNLFCLLDFKSNLGSV